MSEKIAVVGLGYVGLPVALAFARIFPDATGFDINKKRVEALRAGNDRTGETAAEDLRATRLKITCDPADLKSCTAFIVAVPTPIDDFHQPDLSPVLSASRTVGSALKKGDVVIYESTVYPGVTEEICGPELERVSGLKSGVDFFLGYSPERINPGDREHSFEKIVKVVSGQDEKTLDRVAVLYGRVVEAGVHRAASIRVAEAAKVIENTQRDLNIALMNELAVIFERMGIRTADVLAAARTKWNFLPFSPGLVGGHCIGVDPYYLTAKADQLGYHPQVILSGRRINDGMGAFIAQKTVKLLVTAHRPVEGARVGVLGLTFKENVPDIRNSRVPDILREIGQFGITPLVHDPLADADEVREEYGVTLSGLDAMENLDALILAVPHRDYLSGGGKALAARVRPGGVVVDVKSSLDPADAAGRAYWSL